MYLRIVLDLEVRLLAMPGISRDVWVFYNKNQTLIINDGFAM